jgi:uncharacterized membrane protein YhaH (DUF805 family)
MLYNIKVMVNHFHSVNKNLANHPIYKKSMIILFIKFIFVDLVSLISGILLIKLKDSDFGNNADIVHAIGYVLVTIAIISILLDALVALCSFVICACGTPQPKKEK